MRRITELDYKDARKYFLEGKNYFCHDLPTYFVFNELLAEVAKKLDGKSLSDFYRCETEKDKKQKKSRSPEHYKKVNYTLLDNKDGKFAWRPLQLIHPAIYVSLVHEITKQENWETIVKRFKDFQNSQYIRCLSIPLQSESEQSNKAEAVNQWWRQIEQDSLKRALKFEYLVHTDISNCYGSIYTHSVPWALHGKETAKEKRNCKSLIGNRIDTELRSMSYGQTNGIPQGSALMDFIAEMVLGYADLELSDKLKNDQSGQEQLKNCDYEILRYRDDYRIFSNNPQDAEYIVKLLTETLINLGMRLSPEKTMVTSNVIRDSIKPDKLFWIKTKRNRRSLQKHLLIIHDLSDKFPNPGILVKALTKYYKRIKNIKKDKQNIKVLISILVDIMYKNPKTYPTASAILSKFLSLIEKTEEKKEIINFIITKFDKIPNTGHMELWLQRITIKIDRDICHSELLCKKVNGKSKDDIWDSSWLEKGFEKLLKETPIIDKEIIEKMDEVISKEEVELFKSDYYG